MSARIKCCGKAIKRMAANFNPYQYRQSGSDDIRFIGIDMLSFLSCGTENTIQFPSKGNLRAAIARALICARPRLNRSVITFLRVFSDLTVHCSNSIEIKTQP
jgi:hypothetical protein